MTERAIRPPVEGEREAPFALHAGDGWTLDGYGAVFNSPTVIDSFEGRFREQIAPGSMRKSFADRPPKVQYDHGHHPLIGSLPIATLQRAAEEVDPVLAPEGGAHIVARMIPHLFFEPIREAIANGAINGMSFRFTALREMWQDPEGNTIADERALDDWLRRSGNGDLRDDELPIRTLKELRVPECGPVAWPAYEDTSVTMRSTIIDLGRLPFDAEQRKLFARAMWSMADTKENLDAPPDAADKAVAGHPSNSIDAPPDAADKAVAGHPSQTPMQKPRGSRAIDLALRNMRDTLLTIDSGKVNHERHRTHVRNRGAAFRPDPHASAKRQTSRRNQDPRRGTRRAG